jgi:uncharacterized membrane protein
VTLGLFLATFVFSVIILVSNQASVPSARQFAPVVSVTTLLALTVATVFGFLAYLHGVVRLMRVQYLLETIATETRQAIEENFPPASAYLDAEPPSMNPSPQRGQSALGAGKWRRGGLPLPSPSDHVRFAIILGRRPGHDIVREYRILSNGFGARSPRQT